MAEGGTRTSGESIPNSWVAENCYPNLASVLPLMAPGDELVIDDGVYTGAENQIWNGSQYPPDGIDNDHYTIIRARNDGNVTIRSNGERYMFLYYGDVTGPMQYVLFQGIVWFGSNDSDGMETVNLTHSNHVKFIRCGFAESSGSVISDNEAVIGITQSSHILLEECFAWGNGRYKFLVYQSNYVILRRCVARFDWVYEEDNPKADYSIYNSNHVLVQNCISLDGDTRSLWPAGSQDNVDGSFYAPNNSNYSTDVHFQGCMAVNNDMPFGSTSGNGENGPIRYTNCVGWDTWDGFGSTRANTTIAHSTFGNFTHPGYGDDYTAGAPAFNGYGSPNNTIRDSILYGIDVDTSHYVINTSGNAAYETVDNNAFYGCSRYQSGTNGIENIDPLDGSLLYLVRIENGSALNGAASNSGNVGANVLKRYGRSGTLWGEQGYDLLQDGTSGQADENLWPFPFEEKIQEHMQAYNLHGVNGRRGFCAGGTGLYGGPVTLTSYIWEYLGNPIPSEIYSGGYGQGPSILYFLPAIMAPQED